MDPTRRLVAHGLGVLPMTECRRCSSTLIRDHQGRMACPEHGPLGRLVSRPKFGAELTQPPSRLRLVYLASLPDRDVDELMAMARAGHIAVIERRLVVR